MLTNENKMLRNEIGILRAADDSNNNKHFKGTIVLYNNIDELHKLTQKVQQLMVENQNLRFEIDSLKAHEKYHQAQNRVHSIFGDTNIQDDYNRNKINLELAEQKIKELESDTYQRKSRGSTDSHNQDVYNMYINKLSE